MDSQWEAAAQGAVHPKENTGPVGERDNGD